MVLDDTVQIIVAGVLAAGGLGALYATFSARSVERGLLWFVGGTALLVGAVAVLGGGARELVFAALAVTILVSGMFAVREPSLMHATLYLTVTLVGVAGVYLTLGAEFLAAIQVFVYVGAVITLILFTIMLTTPAETTDDLSRIELPFGVSIDSVQDIQKAEPSFTGVGPFKALRETNPRKPTRIPRTLEGVLLTDEGLGSAGEPAPKPERNEEGP